MKPRKLTGFGQKVMGRLNERNMTIFELAEEVENRTGRFMTEAYLRKALRGKRIWYGYIKAIRDILDLHRENAQ